MNPTKLHYIDWRITHMHLCIYLSISRRFPWWASALSSSVAFFVRLCVCSLMCRNKNSTQRQMTLVHSISANELQSEPDSKRNKIMYFFIHFSDSPVEQVSARFTLLVAASAAYTASSLSAMSDWYLVKLCFASTSWLHFNKMEGSGFLRVVTLP